MVVADLLKALGHLVTLHFAQTIHSFKSFSYIKWWFHIMHLSKNQASVYITVYCPLCVVCNNHYFKKK